MPGAITHRGAIFDLGAGKHTHVSCLSPYLRHRIITEKEVLKATLGRHSLQASEKFVQEVFWRTYWKGWLEMRPQIWRDYQHGVMRALDDVQTQSGLRAPLGKRLYGANRYRLF